jgi:hypothetical protein
MTDQRLRRGFYRIDLVLEPHVFVGELIRTWLSGFTI